MNEKDIRTILDQLYESDPGLRQREGEIVAIIRTLALKPKAQYDAAFAADLKTRLLAELAASPKNAAAAAAGRPRAALADLFTRRLGYAIAGLAVLAIAATAAIISVTYKPGQNGGPVALLSPAATITQVDSDAFGTLSAKNTTNGTSGAGGSAGASANNSVSSPAAAMAPAAAPMNAAVTGSIMPVRIIPPYNPTTYAYTGGPFSQNEAQLDVLKKIPQSINADQATLALEQAGFGSPDLSTFGDLGMDSVTLAENRSFGYQISIDFIGGTVSIDQNYDEWPQGSPTPLAQSDIPSDDAVIAIANGFLADHRIAVSTYGAPSVQTLPYAIPASAPAAKPMPETGGAAMPMIPYYSDSEQVLYPLMINSMPVYDSGGNAVGLTVNVNVRYGRVADVYGLGTQSYQSSAYDAITSTSTILAMAENQETYPVIYNGANGGRVLNGTIAAGSGTTFDLGTPTMAYMQTYEADASGTESEYLVPAFVFPVTGGTESVAPASRNVIVPLIKDFTDANPPVIVPLTSSASGGAAASPTEK